MSELAQIWAVKDQGLWQKCLKYGILVSGCSHFMDCEHCIGKVKIQKNVKPVKALKVKPEGKRIKVKKTTQRTKKNTVKRSLKKNKTHKSGGRHVRRIKRTITKKCGVDSGRFGSLFGN